MLQNRFVGRLKEIERLDACLNEERPQLIIVYGRRRVGKTYLINQYFEGAFDFKITGMENSARDVQLENFAAELRRQTGQYIARPSDWTEAFNMLRSYLEDLPASEKHIVFFDEMPWLDTRRSGFLQAFEFFWNDFGCTLNNLVFIVCGSASSWMRKNIGMNKGGLFNRQTCSIFLKPFTLAETELYLQSRNIEWSRYDIAMCYMIMGGIPYYLSLLREDLSPSANIDNLFFRKRAELGDEFQKLYNTLFTGSEQYIKIAEALSEKRSGMTRGELVKKTGANDNGALTEMLENLEASDFIRANRFFGKKKQDTRYQLSDYYSMFYFKFIKDYHGRDEHFWSNSYGSPTYRAWTGLSYESVCFDHIAQIKKKIGIGGVLSEQSSWFQRTDGNSSGAQIDLLIDRADHVINICEIKYSETEHEINKDYEETLRKKIAAFVEATDTKKSLQLTMITTYGIMQGKYSSRVSNQVVLDDLFSRGDSL